MIRMVAFQCGQTDDRSMSGGDRYALELCRHLGAFGYDVGLITSTFGTKIAKRYGYDLRSICIDSNSAKIGTWRLGWLWRFIGAVRATARVKPVDIAYAGSAYFFDLIPATILKLSGRARKLIVPIFHLVPPPFERDGGAARNILAWIEQRLMCALIALVADAVIVDNAGLPEALERRGIPRERIFVSMMGVPDLDACEGSGDGTEANEPLETYDAVYVGRISYAKGIVDLLDAWKRASSDRPWRLALVGNCEPGFDLEGLLRERRLTEANIVNLQGRSDRAVRGLLSRASIFVTASREEGYGLSVLEALAAGTPCVTYALPVFHEAFPIGRREVAIGDSMALADAMRDLLANESERAAMREEIRSRVVIGTWKQVAESVARHLSDTGVCRVEEGHSPSGTGGGYARSDKTVRSA